jgi:FlaA1/EpsC-like NDP-sugar epimerase
MTGRFPKNPHAAAGMPNRIYAIILRTGNRHLLYADILVILSAPVLALALRVENPDEFALYIRSALVLSCLRLLWYLLVYYFSGLYTRYWRYASVDEVISLASASILAWVTGVVVFFALLEPFGVFTQGFPRSVPVIDGALTLLGVGGLRLGIRIASGLGPRRGKGEKVRRVLVAGAGAAGSLTVKELRAHAGLGIEPVAFVDDDERKVGLSIHGVPVLGSLPEIADVVKEQNIDEVFVAMPSAPGRVVRGVIEMCDAAGVRVKTLPGLLEILGGSAAVTAVRDVEIDDLLRRGVVTSDLETIRGLLKGKRLLVTGAGGSIGAELCRQILRCEPSELILLELSENNLFAADAELRKMCRDSGIGTAIHSVVADVRDREHMDSVFRVFGPQIVYHAAAHKHVGLMEQNIAEAVTNNVLGTKTVADLAVAHRLERFVLISSDKAVNPTTVMGATKRVAELLVLDAAVRTGRVFVTVRFGNVLGSSGSVVPIFKRQIAMGGPVTVTSPDATRFFMTIPEAVHLVLQAGTMGEGGEVFILDMGEPVRIIDLARDLIRLSGHEEGSDIAIVYSGLKPGEKLHEELFRESERVERSAHPKIFVSRNARVAPREESSRLSDDVAALLFAANKGMESELRDILRRIVPESSPALHGDVPL